MPRIFQSPVPLFLCLLLSALVSLCWAIFSLLRDFLFTSSPSLFTLNFKSAFSLQRNFSEKSYSARNCSHLLCCCYVSFVWEIARDSPIVNTVSQTMNKHISFSWINMKMRPGYRRQSLCCLETQNAPWHNATWHRWRAPTIHSVVTREAKGDREGIPHTHPIP